MGGALFSVLALGFVLGIKHAIEPDHVIAVSTIASQSKKLWHASLAGVFWGIGHTATLFIIGIILILMKNNISDKWSMSLEFLVGVMLVYLGIVSIVSFRRKEEQSSQEDGHSHPINKRRSYSKSLVIGLIHGLAGSAAMVLLTMGTVHSVWQGALYILVFGSGTIVGMLIFTTVIGLPFVLSTKQTTINRSLTMIAGVISTVFGLYYMYNLGVTEGLFSLWF
ncbi:sulfite exporter TauE/SafE family protein [Pseudobacillus wudalianchiensis]|uniref:Urease accessory protein UreH n=1 Tax=Pseudobacillus wudalianchiensis TaxID=1743143 RepID=A0A1B9B9X4_9BACI|nr:sulfite exporter TauE/SafE family protein [Bacillus wudalianchiensis]OCA92884.1 urease accessory protein UreH [Bacillus wudalianchiensis]